MQAPRDPVSCLMQTILALQAIEKSIKSKNGCPSLWRQRIIDCTDRMKQGPANNSWYQLVRGGDRAHPKHAYVNDYGTECSLRHTKKRLHNLLDEVEDLATQEAKCARERTAANASAIPGPATAALKYYYERKATLNVNYLGTYDQIYAQTRGREWQISLDQNFPEDLPDLPNPHMKTPEQRAFIATSTVPLEVQEEYFQTPRRTSRRAGAKVTFAPEVFVRSEADIDVLRQQNMRSSKTAPRPLFWLDVLFAKSAFEVRELFDGPCRPLRCYSRHNNAGAPGTWSAPEGSFTVDTSGCCLKEDYDSWEGYVRKLEDEAKDEDAEKSVQAAFEAFIAFAIALSFLFLT